MVGTALPPPPSVTHQKLTEWLIPSLLGVLIAILGWMALTLTDISRSLAVAVTRIDELERRVANVETLYRP